MGQDPVRGTVELPGNEALVKSLSESTQRKYMYLKQSVFEVAKERPDLDTRVLTRYMGDYLSAVSKEEATVKTEMDAKRAKNPNMNWVQLRGETDLVNRGSERRYSEFLSGFSKNTVPQYGVEGQEAWKALHNKMHGPSIFGAAANQIYNKEKGGMQWGGIIGLLLGGLMATQLTGGLMTGELVPILATVGTAFLGAWLGNKAMDGIGSMMKKDETPAPQPARSPSQGVTAPAQEAQNTISPGLFEKAQQALKAVPKDNPDANRNRTPSPKSDKDKHLQELARRNDLLALENEALRSINTGKEANERLKEINARLSNLSKEIQEPLSADVKAQADEAINNPPPGSTTQTPAKRKGNNQSRGNSTTPR